MIRAITADDVPWVVSLGSRRYPDGDPGGGLLGLSQAMRIPTALAIRSEHGFLVAHIIVKVWYPQRRDCHIVAVCVEEGHHWEAAKLLRASVDWAREQGCTRWWFDSDTDHEVAALAERVGARTVERYTIDLAEACHEPGRSERQRR